MIDQFRPTLISECCLCSSKIGLSGEHKIKASALRSEFGQRKLAIGAGDSGFRFAQSPKSRCFHFTAPVCGECNSARTQPSDFAFDTFHKCVTTCIENGETADEALFDPRFCAGGALHLGVYRYFAKLLCCHLAQIGAPRQDALSGFAIGFTNTNCISLSVDQDPLYRRMRSDSSDFAYAAHGGLVLIGEGESKYPTAFHSTLTIGAVRYIFEARLTKAGQDMLIAEQPEFF